MSSAKTCFGAGKGQKAHVFLYANNRPSSVGRDRLAKRAKKLQRLSDRQGRR